MSTWTPDAATVDEVEDLKTFLSNVEGQLRDELNNIGGMIATCDLIKAGNMSLTDLCVAWESVRFQYVYAIRENLEYLIEKDLSVAENQADKVEDMLGDGIRTLDPAWEAD